MLLFTAIGRSFETTSNLNREHYYFFCDMKAVILCKSVHKGNTKRIVDAISEVLDCSVKEPEEKVEIQNYNLVGFASGIYYGDFHESIIDAAEESDIKDVYAFQASTSGLWPLPLFNNYEKKMRERLIAKGCKYLGSFTCRGHDEFGPLKYIGGMYKNRPNEKDIEAAKAFAKGISDKFTQDKNI